MDDPVPHLDGIVHEETQGSGRGFDLTLAAVHAVERPGRVDFGGGELADAVKTSLETSKRSPDDDYGWWTLEPGQYLIEHNESLDAPEPAVLQTRREVLARGAFHPTVEVTSLSPIPLAVGGGGIRLKENARVSTLLPSG